MPDAVTRDLCRYETEEANVEYPHCPNCGAVATTLVCINGEDYYCDECPDVRLNVDAWDVEAAFYGLP